MPLTLLGPTKEETLGHAGSSQPVYPTAASFGGCKMCGCRRYKTKSGDYQFCDCGHSRSQHQH